MFESMSESMFESMSESRAIQTGRSARGPALSLTIHCGVAALLLMAGAGSTVRRALPKTTNAIPLIAPYLSLSRGGGGGGGDRSPLPASKGRLPKIAPRQFTPPLAVLDNTNPKLAMEPTLILSPDMSLPPANLAELGDPFGGLGPKSNGPGSGSGIGSGAGTGVGSGKGIGDGPGEGGNSGGPRAGQGAISSPVLLFKVEPEFSEEARKAKHQGVVILSGEVDTNGKLRNVRVVQGLGLGLDEKAMEAVKQWKFRPGYQDGRPVVAAAIIEVNFHLL
jgi:periplasmic protein TonB